MLITIQKHVENYVENERILDKFSNCRECYFSQNPIQVAKFVSLVFELRTAHTSWWMENMLQTFMSSELLNSWAYVVDTIYLINIHSTRTVGPTYCKLIRDRISEVKLFIDNITIQIPSWL